MQSFQTIQPSALLAPYVKRYWFLTANSSVQASERIIPSGQICLMFHRGERLFSSAHNRLQPRAFLDGQETGYTDLLYSGSIDLVCTVFQPAGAKAFFNVPLIELSEQNVAVDDLEDPQLIELGNRLFDTADIQTSVLLIEQFLFKRLRTPAAHNLRRINADNGQSPGAISLAKNFRPSKDGVLISLHVDDMEKALSAVEVNGGEIIRPKTKLEAGGCGYFALFTDSEGNRLGLYSDK